MHTKCCTCADLFRPLKKTHILIYDIACVVGFSFIIALSAQLAVRLPFSPVPVTGQTFAVLLTGALLGSRRGALAVLTYLTQGALGLPVFAGGMAGIGYLAGPTGGFLTGFIFAAFLTGYLAERKWDRQVTTTMLAMTAGSAVIYSFGLVWLAFYVGWNQVITMGLTPFLAGDILKIFAAGLVLPAGWKFLPQRTEC